MLDSIDLQTINCLSVTRALLIALSSSLLEDNDVFSLGNFFNCCINPAILNLGPSECSVIFGANKKHIVNANLGAYFLIQIL